MCDLILNLVQNNTLQIFNLCLCNIITTLSPRYLQLARTLIVALKFVNMQVTAGVIWLRIHECFNLLSANVMTGIRNRQSHYSAVGPRPTSLHVSIPSTSQSAKTRLCNRLVGKRQTAEDAIALSHAWVRLQRTEEMDFVAAVHYSIVSTQWTGKLLQQFTLTTAIVRISRREKCSTKCGMT